MSEKNPKILFYDIETAPMRVWTFSLGKTVLSHKQIVEGDKIDIICICYKWKDDDKVHTLHWGYHAQNSGPMIEKFDKVLQKADIAIAQNGDAFDVKHINTQRLLHNLPPLPDWNRKTDDMLKQLRKYFSLPSYSLDYVSKLLLGRGKLKMELQDWTDIVEKKDKSKFHKMLEYCALDVTELNEVWNKIESHVVPKFNQSAWKGNLCCRTCGSINIHKNGTRLSLKTKYHRFYCTDHGGYAGQLSEAQLKSANLGRKVVMG